MKYKEINPKKQYPLKAGVKDTRKSKNVIKRLQKYLGLKQDGYFGNGTEKKVESVLGKKVVLKKDLDSLEKGFSPTAKKKNIKGLELLVIHCTDTPEGMDVTPEHIEQWHMGKKKRSDGRWQFKGKIYDYEHQIPNGFIGGIPIKISNGRGWDRFGYADLCKLDGEIVNLTPYDNDGLVDKGEITWGATGVNGIARHFVYAGGSNAHGKSKDTRRREQIEAMTKYVFDTLNAHPDIKIGGHGDMPNTSKLCPSFDVPAWLESIGVKEKNIYRK